MRTGEMMAGADAETASSPNRRGLGRGVLLALSASLSNQLGAATGALAFPAIGPLGVVAIRQLVTAAVLLPVGRPRFRAMRWPQWWPVMCLGIVFGVMNGTLYAAIDRIGLGLGITLEFLGPLAIVILSSRRLIDLLGGLLAAAGVVILVNPGPTTDLLGSASASSRPSPGHRTCCSTGRSVGACRVCRARARRAWSRR